MDIRVPFVCVATAFLQMVPCFGEQVSPNGVKSLHPAGTIKTSSGWNVGSRAGDFVYVGGMQGVDPKTNKLVAGDEARVRQAFLNMRLVAKSEGADLADCVRLVCYVSDLKRCGALLDKVEEQLWGKAAFPPRTVVEVRKLYDDDIAEIEGTFYSPVKR